MAVVFFLHGLESGPDGLKIMAMREVAHRQGWRSEAPDFRGMHLVPNAGHWVQFEQPEAFDAALLAALA